MGFDRTQAIHAFRHGKQKSLIIEDVCMALRQDAWTPQCICS